MPVNDDTLARLTRTRDRVAKGALSMVDHANHKPENRSRKPKVGGHQASSMSSLDLLCALYLQVLRPQDKVAVKPHAAPVVYSLMHLMGLLPAHQMTQLRELGGPQPYPTLLKNPLFVDYTSSSEALGVAATIYDALAQRVHNQQLVERTGVEPASARFFALCGDGELTEGQIDESLYDAGRWALDELVWIVDLNRQSLDRVMDDSGHLERWVAKKFEYHGWTVHSLRWGSRARAMFARPGGDALQACLERLTDDLFHPLLLVDGPTLRSALTGTDHTGAHPGFLPSWRERAALTSAETNAATACLQDLPDDELLAAIQHLGGHDLSAIIDALDTAIAHQGSPVVIIAHTVKGFDTSQAAHPENHGMLLPEAEVATWGEDRGLPANTPWPAVHPSDADWLTARGEALFDPSTHGWQSPPLAEWRDALANARCGKRSVSSTGEAFQSFNLSLLRTPLAPWLQFGAPDVGQTTHLGPIIKATGVFATRDLPDTFAWLRHDKKVVFDWRPDPLGQFHSMGIAEGNAMMWAWAFGRRTKPVETRSPLLPVVTVYDKFFERGFNQLDYATYSNARFVAVGVPSGTGLSRETATHQSLQTLRMMMDLPGIVAYEPAFAADVEAIYRWSLAQCWDDDGEAVYLRLSTQPLPQPTELPADHSSQAIKGAYWLCGEDKREPTAGAERVIFIASGRKVADCQTAAARLLSEDGVGSAILNVTSYEALWREWDAWNHDPEAWSDESRSYWLHELFSDADVNAPLILTGDHLPSACDWLPGALQRTRGYRFCGPRRNGEAGDLEAVDRLHGMHPDDLVAAARAELAWRRRTRS